MPDKSIIYITPAMPVGGAERFLLTLSKELMAYTRRQSIINLSAVDVLAGQIAPGVEYIPLPRKGKFDLRPLRQIRKMIKADKPDIIFCINFFAYFVTRLALMGVRRKPHIIISYHSTRHQTRKEHWLHYLYARMLRKSEEVICVSEKQAEFTRHTYRIPEKQMMVVLNCVDTGFWKPWTDASARESLRKELGLPEGVPVIVLSAAFRPEKNHVGAINALKILREKHQVNSYLLLVGDGPMRSVIEEEINKQGMQEFVKLTGMQKDVRPFYQAADIFTLCSRSVETFSIAALEAMSCGLPIVLTDVGGASEMVRTGINGNLTSPNEEHIAAAWKAALTGGYDRFNIHQFARENFGKDKMTKAYLELLNLTS